MAAVFAVRREGRGFNKLLAMKMLLPNLAEPRFKNMFLDEVRLAGRLQHANLAQVFDVGEYEGLPWLVMEFLHGKSLSQCCARAAELNRPLTPAFTTAVLAAAAEGLHAAHETTGPLGEPLRVVHRDVSPQNVHVGYDGHVKVVDFGIAAASGRLTTTRTGEVKGKLSYVAPEQLASAPVDRRADVWALGVVAWETFTSRRLFTAGSESQTMYNVLQAPVEPLSQAAPQVPVSLGEMVDRCLVREPAGRLSQVNEFAAVFRAHAPTNASEVIRDELERLFGLDRLTEVAELEGAVPNTPALVAQSQPSPADVAQPLTLSSVETASPQEALAPVGATPSRRARLGVVAALVAVGVLGALWAFRVASHEVARASRAGLTSTPESPPSPVKNDVTNVQVAQPPALGEAPLSRGTPVENTPSSSPSKPGRVTTRRKPDDKTKQPAASPRVEPPREVVPTEASPLLENPYGAEHR